MRAPSSLILPNRFTRCLALLLALTAAASAQPSVPPQSAAAVPTFDVVTIKPSKSVGGNLNVSINDANFGATNITLKTFILQAYSLKDSQLVGLPPWGDSAHFDIEAKVTAPDKQLFNGLTDAQRRAMLQPILTGRFQLKFHRERQIRSVYELIIAKGGPRFHATPASEAAKLTGVNGVRPITFSVRNGSFTAADTPISTLAHYLPDLQRVIVDKTGLTGKYNLQLKWTPEDAPPSTASDAPPDIFTALREQLGLELKPSKAPIEIFVIDHVTMPSEN